MKPPNKRHVGDTINSHVLYLVERLFHFLEVQIVLLLKGETGIFGSQQLSTIDRFIHTIVSLSRRVHYWRFHCTYNHKLINQPTFLGCSTHEMCVGEIERCLKIELFGDHVFNLATGIQVQPRERSIKLA